MDATKEFIELFFVFEMASKESLWHGIDRKIGNFNQNQMDFHLDVSTELSIEWRFLDKQVEKLGIHTKPC